MKILYYEMLNHLAEKYDLKYTCLIKINFKKQILIFPHVILILAVNNPIFSTNQFIQLLIFFFQRTFNSFDFMKRKKIILHNFRYKNIHI